MQFIRTSPKSVDLLSSFLETNAHVSATITFGLCATEQRPPTSPSSNLHARDLKSEPSRRRSMLELEHTPSTTGLTGLTFNTAILQCILSMYTAYGPRGRYWNPASPVRLTWSQLDRSNFACARSAVTSLVPLERKETQPFFGTSLKKIGESVWVHELRQVFSAFWWKLFGLLGKRGRNDPWAWRLV